MLANVCIFVERWEEVLGLVSPMRVCCDWVRLQMAALYCILCVGSLSVNDLSLFTRRLNTTQTNEAVKGTVMEGK